MSHRVGDIYKKPEPKESLPWSEIIGAPIALGMVIGFLYLLLLIGGTF